MYLGDVLVTTRVTGYQKSRPLTEEVLDEEWLDLPPRIFNTVALWFDIPEQFLDEADEKKLDLAGSLHAAEHAMIGVLPLFALCDRNDIGGVSTPLHPDTRQPQIFIYDGHPGGIGIAEMGYQMVGQLWNATLNVVTQVGRVYSSLRRKTSHEPLASAAIAPRDTASDFQVPSTTDSSSATLVANSISWIGQ